MTVGQTGMMNRGRREGQAGRHDEQKRERGMVSLIMNADNNLSD
jgi:hypothetical protein